MQKTGPMWVARYYFCNSANLENRCFRRKYLGRYRSHFSNSVSREETTIPSPPLFRSAWWECENNNEKPLSIRCPRNTRFAPSPSLCYLRASITQRWTHMMADGGRTNVSGHSLGVRRAAPVPSENTCGGGLTGVSRLLNEKWWVQSST